MRLNDGEYKEIPVEIHRSQFHVGVWDNRESCGFIFQTGGERTIGGILADFVINDKGFCLGGVFGNRAENGSVFYNKVRGGVDYNFRAFRKSNAFAVVFDGELNRPGIAGLNECLRRADKRQEKDNGRNKQEFINNNFCAKNSAAENIIFGSARRSRANGAEEIISWCHNMQREMRYTASYARGVALCPSLTRRASAPHARPESLLNRSFL